MAVTVTEDVVAAEDEAKGQVEAKKLLAVETAGVDATEAEADVAAAAVADGASSQRAAQWRGLSGPIRSLRWPPLQVDVGLLRDGNGSLWCEEAAIFPQRRSSRSALAWTGASCRCR